MDLEYMVQWMVLHIMSYMLKLLPIRLQKLFISHFAEAVHRFGNPLRVQSDFSIEHTLIRIAHASNPSWWTMESFSCWLINPQ